MRSDPPEDPMARLDTQRCDTRALDAGALRAIQAAYASGVEQASGIDPALAALAAVPANDAASNVAPDTERDAAADTIVEPSPERRDDPIAGRWASERPTERIDPAALPSAHGAPSMRGRGAADASTLEVDYSPAARRDRARAATVRRTARAVTAACVGLAAILAVWAAFRSANDGAPPRAAEQAVSVPAARTLPLAGSAPPAQTTPTTLPEPSSPPSAPIQSTIPTGPVVPPAALSGRASAATPVPRATGAVPIARAASSSPGPEPGASAAPVVVPSVTVPAPPGGTVALPNPD